MCCKYQRLRSAGVALPNGGFAVINTALKTIAKLATVYVSNHE
ncbi:hypothetical protein YpE1979001_0419 [Yersinia pestis biovar Antiqua str. E1979001]|nr:hypothetical protein YpE1979001_0419 [Yersinia pestis biovar Antiqua str. E1979001]